MAHVSCSQDTSGSYLGGPANESPRSLVKASDVSELVTCRLLLPLRPPPIEANVLEGHYQRWFDWCPEVFAFVVSSENRCGLSCMLPLTRSAFQNFVSGVLSEWEIYGKHLAHPEHEEPYAIYVQIVGVSNPKRPPYIASLIHTCCRQLAQLARNADKELPLIVTDVANAKGLALTARYGFRPVGQSENEEPIVVLDLNDTGSLDSRVRARVEKLKALILGYRLR